MTTDDDVRRVTALEIELQRPDVRADPRRLGELLAPDFEEVGASGRVWDRAAILDLLAAETAERARRPAAAASRTSLWRNDPQGWRLVRHQGTVLP